MQKCAMSATRDKNLKALFSGKDIYCPNCSDSKNKNPLSRYVSIDTVLNDYADAEFLDNNYGAHYNYDESSKKFTLEWTQDEPAQMLDLCPGEISSLEELIPVCQSFSKFLINANLVLYIGFHCYDECFRSDFVYVWNKKFKHLNIFESTVGFKKPTEIKIFADNKNISINYKDTFFRTQLNNKLRININNAKNVKNYLEKLMLLGNSNDL